jgi:hypothetical protein
MNDSMRAEPGASATIDPFAYFKKHKFTLGALPPNSKEPYTEAKHGLKGAHPNYWHTAEPAEWEWLKSSGRNLAIPAAPNNLLEIDIDVSIVGKAAAYRAYVGLLAKCGIAEPVKPGDPFAPQTRSRSGGWHVYGRLPATLPFDDLKGYCYPVRVRDILPDHPDGDKEVIGFRRTGMYLVAPGSTVDGGEYKLINDAPPYAVSTAMLAMMRDETPGVYTASPESLREVEELLTKLSPSAIAHLNDDEGDRSSKVAAAVGSLIRFGCSDDEIESLIAAHPVGSRFEGDKKRMRKDIERLRKKGFGTAQKGTREMFGSKGAAVVTMDGAAYSPEAGVPLRMDEDKAIADLNTEYAYVRMKGNIVILKEGGKDGIEYLLPQTFRGWHLNDLVRVFRQNKKGETVEVYTPVADVWLRSSRRRQYAGVDFAPAGQAYPGYFNLWTGWGVAALDISLDEAQKRCSLFLDHVHKIVCGGDNDQYRYVLAWMADIVQSPATLKGVALILRGKKGTGKSKVLDILRKVIGMRHTVTVAHGRQLTGNFNSHHVGKLLIVAEESFWSGDKAAEGPLKNLITAETAMIELKGKDCFEVPSFIRVGMITNSDWAVPASEDERRYAVFDVSDTRKDDYDYFAAIDAEMVGGGFEALFTVLQKLDLSAINLRKVPETSGLRKQRAHSLEPHDQFVLDMIHGLDVRGTSLGETAASFTKKDVYDAYTRHSNAQGKTHLLSYNEFSGKFAKATGAKTTKPHGQARRFSLLALAAVREHFSAYAKVDIVEVV